MTKYDVHDESGRKIGEVVPKADGADAAFLLGALGAKVAADRVEKSGTLGWAESIVIALGGLPLIIVFNTRPSPLFLIGSLILAVVWGIMVHTLFERRGW